ncbi:hypothetical protein MNBD_BACTEROID03-2189 [hydrothermal vent metagenome]|uniref:VanZ-like domain-containing protein n=1 Tax=hydrothermal vent metagenome TaxID=652676 RepID=A0A3B0TTR9_9ZZZZ
MAFGTFSSLYSFSGVDAQSFSIPHFDKAVHFMFYFVACILGVFFLRERSNGKMNLMKTLIAMVFATVVFGILIEVIQYEYTAQRMGDVYDALANSIGSICGALTVKLFFLRKRQLKWKY